MLLKPHSDDLKVIAFYLGKIIIGLGATMGIPVALGLILRERGPALDFIISIELTLILGLTLTHFCRVEKSPGWMHGMLIVSLSWLVAMYLGAIPLSMSGHWKSYLDACFDSMSGFATTGLTLVQDLDHLSYTHNLWRHLIMFIGGQGIVIIALSLFVKGFTGGFTLYVGEARDEKILPNIAHTSRFIWGVSRVYLVLGTAALGIT
jgi:trk system potassium uptake protein TrkH